MAYNSLSELFKATADAIRSKTGSTDSIVANDFPLAIAAIPTGSGGDPVVPDEDWIGDGNTHIWITLHEGRTSPMLGVCPKGTVIVDWGDGTASDILTGTSLSTVKWTPTHNYAAPGDYVITLTVDGEMGLGGLNSSNQYSYILRHSSSATSINVVYQNAVNKVELGAGIKSIGNYAFYGCYSLASINIPDSVTSIGHYVFQNCYALAFINIPDSVTSIGTNTFIACRSLASINISKGITNIGNTMFNTCCSLASVNIPDGVESIDSNVFQNCFSLSSINIPDSVTSIGRATFHSCYALTSINIPDNVTDIGDSAFNSCYSLTSINIPDGITSIGSNMFYGCHSLASINIPDSVTSIGNGVFNNCYSLASISIPDSVTSIGDSAFNNCYGVRFYDFSNHAVVPTLSNTNAFTNIPADCEIRVPAALYDEWIAAENWATYASQIVAV